MSTLLLVALVAALVGVGLVLLPLTLHFSLQARGEPNGFWALGGGVQLGPFAGSGVAAKGVPAQLALHAFGRKLWSRKLGELGAERAEPEEPAEPPAKTKLRERFAKLERWFDPVDLFFFLVHERRRIELLPTIVDLEYGFRDIATTGKLLGAIYAISPLLPAPILVRQSPSWESLDRASLASSGAIRLWPGLLVVDAAWYLIRNVKVRRPNGAAGGTREAT
ncbi:MAG: DUF2953 domain-containing protein [Polyangiaceae bacterium]|nr:DUF2953 domain-containing protein [Polyangiaceae bacterium]MCL4751718.1 DUF2953 domain-containing protein [Myxococcales bacterium]